jgi:hypothetical protein
MILAQNINETNFGNTLGGAAALRLFCHQEGECAR